MALAFYNILSTNLIIFSYKKNYKKKYKLLDAINTVKHP